jgi:signal transduction histidine kinase
LAARSHPAIAVPLGWWTIALIAVVLAVNAAGVWEIAVAQRDLREQGARTLALQTEARARAIESVLATTTADLAFLVGSTAAKIESSAGRDGWRDELGGSLLLTLRGHAPVASLVLFGRDGLPLLEAGRPRGIPGFWVPGARGSVAEPLAMPLRREFEIPAAEPGGETPARFEASIDPEILLREGGGGAAAQVSCTLHDAAGAVLGREELPATVDAPPAEVSLETAGWSASSERWRLRCHPLDAPATASFAPLVARARLTIVLNVVVMGLAAALGAFAFHQSRRRQQLEARSHEETRVRDLERQLFHAERLGTVGRLAAGMAHEINNPLEGMSNYLRLAENALERGELDAAASRLGGVRQGLERAAGIVRRVLDHANPGAALHELVDVADVARRSLEFVRSREEFAEIRFACEFASGDAAHVRGSAVMLGQVFLNLVLNACEAQPRGGEVVVSCRTNGRWLESEVADRGPGVPADRRSRIFEPFETSKLSAGLGLSICHSIVEQHQGELTLHERPGGGSVFRVRLKLAAEVIRDA